VYGRIAGVAPLFNAATMSDHQLVELVRTAPAVQHARHRCDWIVVTALYQPKVLNLNPPYTNTSECWLAFVDRDEHAAPGWTKIPLVLFDTYERNENIFKVIMPAVLPQQRFVVLNHALPQARCLSLAHMIRGKELAKDATNQPHLLASRIPGWSGRAVLSGQLEMTKGYLDRRNSTTDLAEFAEQEARMTRAGFNTSQRLPVTDTLWMIWPAADEVAEKFSRLWLHEVARFSLFEKVSYAWVVSQVPHFKPHLTDAIYIYSPEQRVCPGSGNATSSGAGKKKSKRSRSRSLGTKSKRRHERRLLHSGRSLRRLGGGSRASVGF